MNSRFDASLKAIRLTGETSIAADFARYDASDALCCPSRLSTVIYTLRRDDIPDLAPTNITTSAACQTTEQTESDSNDGAVSLFGRRWTLTEIGEQRLSADKPFIEFDREQHRVSGDAGCNRFTGGFEIAGASLRFSPIAATKRACSSAEDNRLETSFLQLLGETTRFEVQTDTLRLFANDRLILVFKSGANDAGQTASVTGTIRYLQRSALAPNAVIEVKLLDVSRADAAVITIAEQTIESEGRQVPFRFELRYDPRRIDPRNRYAVRAQILENGKLRFISTRAFPVITNGNPNTIEVIINPVR